LTGIVGNIHWNRKSEYLCFAGIIMLRNKTGEPCEVVAPVAVKKAPSASDEDEEGDEPEPPQPFRYEEDE